MARMGREAGERGTLETRTTTRGLIQGFFTPKEAPGTEAAGRLSAGVKLVEASPSRDQLAIYPTGTRPWRDEFLGPKYPRIV